MRQVKTKWQTKSKPKKLHVKKGDFVKVVSGSCKGASGKIAAVSIKEGKVIIENVNVAVKHLKPKQEGQSGSIVKVEAPMYASKVMLVCPKCSKTTRLAHGFDAKQKKKRKCVHCNELF